MLLRLVLAVMLLSAPALADEPAPPIVFDADGKGYLTVPLPEPAMPELEQPKDVSDLAVWGPPWWWRSPWDYDVEALYLFGDPYAYRRIFDPPCGW